MPDKGEPSVSTLKEVTTYISHISHAKRAKRQKPETHKKINNPTNMCCTVILFD